MTIPRCKKVNFSSPNQNERIRFLVLHFTALSLEKTFFEFEFSDRKVSAHYVIPEQSTEGADYFEVVPQDKRAWHAGVSWWQGRSNLNDTSIGIEYVNESSVDDEKNMRFLPFSDHQRVVGIELCKSIVERYEIDPTCVVAHSDIAVGRKSDPGPMFPWEEMAQAGVGAWAFAQDLSSVASDLHEQFISIAWMQQSLKNYGYAIEVTGIEDQQTQNTLRAFQLHFRAGNFEGKVDYESALILSALLKKYRPLLYVPLREFRAGEKTQRSSSV